MKFKMTPNKLMIALFTVVIFAVPIITAVLPKADSSENENRKLAKMPSLVNEKKMEQAQNPADFFGAIRWDYLTDRKGDAFKDDFETYFCDHMAGRELWVKLSNRLSVMAGKREINGVYTVNNRMFQGFKDYDPEVVEKSIKAINGFAAKFPDISMSFMLAPTSQEIFGSQVPSYTGLLSEKAFIDKVYGKLENISTIDCLTNISTHKDEYVFYRTDHHWTSLGAYYAYSSAAKTLGYSAYGLNSFNIETASSSFRGTLYSRTLDDSITPDSIQYYFHSSKEPNIKMTCINDKDVKEYDSLYVRDFLDVKDKYSSFTGSNVPIVTIETDVDTDKTLLIVKDSYAHSLVPFLSKHYKKITMVDMRYIHAGLDRFIDMSEYSQALFMFNVISFSEDTYLPVLVLTQ